MSSRHCGAVVFVLTLLIATGAFAQQKPTRLETAQWAAGINAQSPAGREWKELHGEAIGKQLVPVLNKCLPEGGDEVTAFSVFLRLSRTGRVAEVLTDLDEASVGACMTLAATDLQLPRPPRDDYWFQLNLAAPL
ncbi:MAG TPA: hypothetical protein VEQ10_04115 [Vicinamibacteria bacterium]|nr:hypothetical protein [Vicinamibacteria bacterium]